MVTEFATPLERNLYQEAKVYVYSGVELKPRQEATAAIRAAHIEAFTKQWEAEFKREWTFASPSRIVKPWTTAQRKSIEERLQGCLQYTENKLGISLEELNVWLEWANNRYEITQDNEVLSYARGDKMKDGEPQVWSTKTEEEAEAQIADMLTYLIWNRNIGRGDVNEDLSGVKELQ
jgi:hypothetical protein